MKNFLENAQIIGGGAAITAGCALAWRPLGFIVGGALLAGTRLWLALGEDDAAGGGA